MASALGQGRQAVRDDDHGAPGDQLAQVVEEDRLGLRVEGAGRLVQDQDARLRQQRAGDRQALLLAAGEVGAVLLQQGVVALGQALDELVGPGDAGGGDDLLEGAPWAW